MYFEPWARLNIAALDSILVAPEKHRIEEWVPRARSAFVHWCFCYADVLPLSILYHSLTSLYLHTAIVLSFSLNYNSNFFLVYLLYNAWINNSLVYENSFINEEDYLTFIHQVACSWRSPWLTILILLVTNDNYAMAKSRVLPKVIALICSIDFIRENFYTKPTL